MTVKEHLQKLHEDSVSHHEAVAKGHRKLAKLFGASGIESCDDIAAAHESIAKCHDKAAATHGDMLKTVGDDLNKLVPDQISGVLPEFRMVPRYGAPQAPAKPNVAPEFEKLVAIEDDLATM